MSCKEAPNASGTRTPLPTYALVSHESAVDAIWTLAARDWAGVLDDEDIWAVPNSALCVTTQGDFKRLIESVDMSAMGVSGAPVDLLVPNKTCASRGKRARFHVWNDYFPVGSLIRVHDRVFVSGPCFVVVQLATARRAGRLQKRRAEASAAEDARVRRELGIDGAPSTASDLLRWENISRFARAAQVLMDFMGSYRYVPAEDGSAWSVDYQVQPILEPGSFREFLSQFGTSKGIQRARAVAKAACAHAASPMETVLALMLTLAADMGGFGLPKPQLNYEVRIDPDVRELSSQDTIVCDLCWPEHKLALEYYGWDVHFGLGPRKVASDAARANSLSALGWTVLHVTFEQMKSVEGLSLLARQVAEKLAVDLAVPSDLERVWRTRLLAQLLPEQTLVA